MSELSTVSTASGGMQRCVLANFGENKYRQKQKQGTNNNLSDFDYANDILCSFSDTYGNMADMLADLDTLAGSGNKLEKDGRIESRTNNGSPPAPAYKERKFYYLL